MNWTKPQPFTIEELDLLSIVIDPDIQPREGLDHEAVKDYAMAMMQGDQLPPLDVFLIEGVRKIAGGFHRYEAARQALKTSYKCNLYHGTQSDARLFALQANRTNGKRMSDKARAVRIALEINPDWSDRKIGEHVGVDHKTVAVYRPRPAAPEPEPATPTPATKPTSQAIRASGEIPQAAVYIEARIKDLQAFDSTDEEDDRLFSLHEKAMKGGVITNAEYDEVDSIIKTAKYRFTEAAKKEPKGLAFDEQPADIYTPPLFPGIDDDDAYEQLDQASADDDRVMEEAEKAPLSDYGRSVLNSINHLLIGGKTTKEQDNTLCLIKKEILESHIVPDAYANYVKELEQSLKTADTSKQASPQAAGNPTPAPAPQAPAKAKTETDDDGDELPTHDALGNPIPRFNIRLAFAYAGKKLKAHAGALMEIKMRLRSESHHHSYAALDVDKTDQTFVALYQTLRAAEPYAICPACNGDQCKACNKRGWMTHQEHKAATEPKPESTLNLPPGLSEQCEHVMITLASFGDNGATGEEIAERGKMEKSTVSARISRLRELGLIIEPDNEQRPTKKGRTAQVIYLSEKVKVGTNNEP